MKKHLITSLLILCSINFMAADSKDSLNISFLSDGYRLEGKLIKPANPEGKVPAIIFLSGSGGNSSYARDYKKFLNFFLETPFHNQDVSFLYFDKRGVGPSEGKWYKTNFEDRAIDAKSAAEYLKTLPFIDEEKIYLVGHSQGGWIVQIALSKYPDLFAGGVSMAGPTFGVKKQVINEYQSKFICAEDLSAELALKKATKKVKRDLTLISLLPLKEDWKQLNLIKNFEPASYLVNNQKPILLMFAENDALVNPLSSLEDLEKLFPIGIPQNIKTHISLGENHSFKSSPLCYKGKWSDLQFSDKSRNVMRDWLIEEIKK